MADNSPRYYWTGRDGVRYYADEATDRHLLYYYRQLSERLAHDGTRLPSALRFGLQSSLFAVNTEIRRRGLEPLPIRTPDEKREDEARRQQYQQQPETPPRPPTVAVRAAFAQIVMAPPPATRAKPKPKPAPPTGIPIVSTKPAGRKVIIRKDEEDKM